MILAAFFLAIVYTGRNAARSSRLPISGGVTAPSHPESNNSHVLNGASALHFLRFARRYREIPAISGITLPANKVSAALGA